MKVCYNNLWKLLIDRNMNKTELKEAAGISFNVIARMSKNEAVSFESIGKICAVLNCDIGDVVEIVQEPKEVAAKKPRSIELFAGAGGLALGIEKAGFDTRLGRMPKGLDTCLYKDFEEDGVEISGGEAQKIALARALYKDAPFIVLDEPTAALDPISEYEVYSKFNEIVGDKTAIYISHRLSSCRFCDNIAVFDNGQIVQTGSHDELVANEDGKYYELWYAQAKYYSDKKSN